VRSHTESRRREQASRRRAEDQFREEHHDAHAVTVRVKAAAADAHPSSAVAPTAIASDRGARPSATGRMLVRILKKVPAPVMDGFEMPAFRTDRTYAVDPRMGRYLVLAGYATRVDKPRS